MPHPKVSVVIVNYNVKELILTCLRTLYQYHTELSIEVIVVDNQSKDGSCDAIKSEFPEVVLIENQENAGFPKGNNQGFAVAKGNYIFMLNPDTEFTDNAIEKIVEYNEMHPEIDLIGPRLLNSDGSIQYSAWRYPSIASVFCESFYLNRFLNKKNYRDKNWEEPFQAETFSGAAIFFKRSVLEQIGNLDETMFWIEDVEFCYRANHAGLMCQYLPTAQVIHHVGQSAKKNYNISISNQVFNKIKFFKKHHSTIAWLTIVAISFFHVLFKIFLFGLLSPVNVVYWRKFKAYLYTFPRIFNPPKGIA